MDEPRDLTRRTLLLSSGLVALGGTLAAACSGQNPASAPAAPSEPAPSPTFVEPRSKLSGDLRILLWSHFVPSHDTWFDPFAKDWGTKVGVNVTVDHIDNTQIPARIASEIQAGQGHDLIQYIA